MIAILATIAGDEGWDDIELYAESHQLWLEERLLQETEQRGLDGNRRERLVQEMECLMQTHTEEYSL
jgi:hypothetical protein